MVSKLKYAGRKNTNDRRMIGYFTMFALEDDSQVFIGASNIKTVEKFWNKLSLMNLDKSQVVCCELYSVKSKL